MVVTTVLGDIPPGELGFCQSHEHLCIREGYPASVSPDQRIDDAGKSGEELALYKKAGGAALVDAQPPGCGRDAVFLAELSRTSGVHIVASTGFHRMRFYPPGHWIRTAGGDELTRIFIDELETGMFVNCDDSDPRERRPIRAGQIKAALDTGDWDARRETLFSAAAAAAQETGRALMVHIEKGSDPLRLADFLRARGTAPEKTVFCHLDRSVADLAVHKTLCEQGITLEYDTIARYKYHDDEKELAIILEMLEGGWERQLLMSLDVTRLRLRSYGGEPGLAFILEQFIPLLAARGVSAEQIGLFFTGNPSRIFAH